jgi:hypothetical protein
MTKDDNHYKFLQLWTKCAYLEGYNKRHWQLLSRLMDMAMRYNDGGEAEKFVLFLAEIYLKTHQETTENGN